MPNNGLLAGAAGILALDAYTYLDMLVRGRPPSELPSTVVQKLADGAGIAPLASDEGDAPKNRRSGAGALMGYGVGLGSAVAYAALRPSTQDWLPWAVGGVLLGGVTLVLSEGTATKLGATDWSQWTPSEWISDIVPRTLYGLTVAYVFECGRDDSGDKATP